MAQSRTPRAPKAVKPEIVAADEPQFWPVQFIQVGEESQAVVLVPAAFKAVAEKLGILLNTCQSASVSTRDQSAEVVLARVLEAYAAYVRSPGEVTAPAADPETADAS